VFGAVEYAGYSATDGRYSAAMVMGRAGAWRGTAGCGYLYYGAQKTKTPMMNGIPMLGWEWRITNRGCCAVTTAP